MNKLIEEDNAVRVSRKAESTAVKVDVSNAVLIIVHLVSLSKKDQVGDSQILRRSKLGVLSTAPINSRVGYFILAIEPDFSTVICGQH